VLTEEKDLSVSIKNKLKPKTAGTPHPTAAGRTHLLVDRMLYDCLSI